MIEFIKDSSKSKLILYTIIFLIQLIVGYKLIVIAYEEIISDYTKKEYKGIVITKYFVGKYPHVVFYCDSLNRRIDFKTSYNEYANTFFEDSIKVNLTDKQINE